MAEGTSPNQKDMVCPTFINSWLQEGHPVSDNSMWPAKNCVYFQSGSCRFGARCRYPHVLDSIPPISSAQHYSQSIGQPLPISVDVGLQNLNLNDRDENKAVNDTQSNDNLNDNKTNLKLSSSNPPNWVDAPEFVPRSYASAVRANNSEYRLPWPDDPIQKVLCPDHIIGECKMVSCPYVHGNRCELCDLAILNPNDENQSKEHIEACEKEIENDMELSFAVQGSIDKSCGICLDIVMEKQPFSERRFGILDNCTHVFCLSCIRTWRQQKNTFQDYDLDNALNPNVIRSCPTCRVSSDFIVPSRYWVETQEGKQKLIADYKAALSKKHCKYFKHGNADCPFGGNCFYLHALEDGTKVHLPKPSKRRRQNQNGEIDVIEDFTLWEFLELRGESHLSLDDDVYSILDSDDSDTADLFD